MRYAKRILTVWLTFGALACSAREEPHAGVSDCRETPDSTQCVGTTALVCAHDGEVDHFIDCAATGRLCIDGIGCSVCVPNSGACEGDNAKRCRADGSGYDVVESCDQSANEVCDPHSGACENPCAVAEAENSYLGCSYWPVMTMNDQLTPAESFPFAVAIANTTQYEAHVSVTSGVNTWNASVAPGGLEVMELPWNDELRRSNSASGTNSLIVRDGAFHLISTVPVAVYQFNPLDFRTPSFCGGSTGCSYSYSNDASLLLPEHVLTGNYTIAAFGGQRSELWGSNPEPDSVLLAPSMFAITSVQDGVNVHITFSANVLVAPSVESPDPREQIFAPGESGDFTLDAGDVLQIISAPPITCPVGSPSDTTTIDGQAARYVYCDVGRDFDLTGTVVRADGPVQVTAGHDCAQVPFNKRRCDHLEETLYPEDTWGHNAIVSVATPLRGEPNLLRVVSGGDDNVVTFDPASVHARVTLQHGEFIEVETTQDVAIQGSQPILVAQFLVSQQYAGFGTTEPNAPGDPSMSLAIPTEQFLNHYTFLAPQTFDDNHLNVSAPTGSNVTLDGVAVDGFSPVGSSGLSVARIPISGGVHSVTSATPFGIVVYGYAAHTSYMYPGGLNLTPINLF